MEYINVGAFIDGRRAPSKRALKLVLADKPERVTFDRTSAFGPSAEIRGDQLAEYGDVTLVVVGPDPFVKRSFYANVVLNAKTGQPKLT